MEVVFTANNSIKLLMGKAKNKKKLRIPSADNSAKIYYQLKRAQTLVPKGEEH
jgi:hypothetical protein